MSNEYGYGCGFGVEMIVLLIFFAMFANGNGNGLFTNNGNTAAETAALVQQDNLRSLAANTNATLGWNQQLLGGAVQALERIGDKVDRNLANTQQQFGRLDTNLCQLGNNIAQQVNAVQTNMNDKFCQTNQHIDCAKDTILAYLNEQRYQQLQQQYNDLKVAYATNQARCEREADTRTILNAIASNNGCQRGYNGNCGGYPAPYCSFAPFGNEYQNAVIAGLTGINQGISGLQQSQAAQTTTLNAIQTRVNQIPTAAA